MAFKSSAAISGISDSKLNEIVSALTSALSKTAAGRDKRGGTAKTETLSTLGAAALDRHWRNLRTHTLHDPLDYKLKKLGDWALNSNLPTPECLHIKTKIMKNIHTILTSILLIFSVSAFAQTTQVVVRAQAKDAKFIGTAIGGAYVTIRNDLTGEILAKGLTTGSSGNTDLLMKTALKRGDNLTDDQTAKFLAKVQIDEPTFVTVEVTAPYTRKNAAIKVTTQLWLIPGKDILGDGVVLEIPGFILDVLAPQTHQVIVSTSLKDNKVLLKASLVMMCGCAISKGGTWDSESIEFKAIVKIEGKKTTEVTLHITDQTNIFDGTIDASVKGNYEVELYAYDKKTGNTGVDKVNFVIQ